MSNNDQIILDKTLKHQRKERAAHLKPEEYFVLFAAEQLLKHFDLSYEELLSGRVDGGWYRSDEVSDCSVCGSLLMGGHPAIKC